MDPVLQLQDALLKQETVSDPGFLRTLLKSKSNVLPLYIFATQISRNITPDMLLTQSINVVTDTNSLLYPAIALRYGANANLYVRSSRYGVIHIIIYAYVNLADKIDKSVLRNLIILLIESGSKIRLSYSTENPISIEQYLINNQYRNDYLYPSSYNIEDLTLSSMLLDRAMHNIELQPRIFNFNSIRVLKTMYPGHNLYYSATKFFLSGFEYILQNNIVADYTLINRLIYLLSLQKEQNHVIAVTQIAEMLLSCINYDASLDEYQLEYLNSIDPQIASRLKGIYKGMWWQRKAVENELIDYKLEPDIHVPSEYATGRNLSKQEIFEVLRESSDAKTVDNMESDYLINSLRQLGAWHDISNEYWLTLDSAQLESILQLNGSNFQLHMYPNKLALATFARLLVSSYHSDPKWTYRILMSIRPKRTTSGYVPTKYSIMHNIGTPSGATGWGDPAVIVEPPVPVQYPQVQKTAEIPGSITDVYSIRTPPQSLKS